MATTSEPGNLRTRAVRGAMTVAARGLAIRLIAFAGSLVLARLLAPEAFGALAIGLSLSTFATLASDAGLGAALIRRTEAPSRTDLRAAVGFQLGVAAMLAAGFAVVAVLVGGTALGVSAVMMASVPLYVWRSPGVIEFERLLAYRPLAAIEVSETIAYQVFAIGAVLAGSGVWGVAAASSVRAVVGTALVARRAACGLVLPRWSWRVVRPLLRFGKDIQGGILVNVARDNLFNLIVAGLAGLTVLGYWSLAYRLLQPITLMFDAISRVAFAAFSRLADSATGIDAAPVLAAIRMIAVSSGLALTLLVTAAPNSIGLIFGERWQPVAKVLPLACLGIYLSSPVLITAGNYLYALGRSRAVLLTVAVSACVGLGGTAVGYEAFGIAGLGLGLTLGGTVEITLLSLGLQGSGPTLVLRPLAGPLVAGLAGSAIGLYLSARTGQDVVGIVVPPLVGAVVYAVLAPIVARGAARTTISVVTSSIRGSHA